MNTRVPEERTVGASKTTRTIGWGAVLRFALFILVTPLALFGSAGRLDWVMGWVYVGLVVVFALASRLVVWRISPDLLAERARSMEATDAKAWDKRLVPLVALFGPLTILIVAGSGSAQRLVAASHTCCSIECAGGDRAGIPVRHLGHGRQSILLRVCAHSARQEPRHRCGRPVSLRPSPGLREFDRRQSGSADHARFAMGAGAGCADVAACVIVRDRAGRWTSAGESCQATPNTRSARAIDCCPACGETGGFA